MKDVVIKEKELVGLFSEPIQELRDLKNEWNTPEIEKMAKRLLHIVVNESAEYEDQTGAVIGKYKCFLKTCNLNNQEKSIVLSTILMAVPFVKNEEKNTIEKDRDALDKIIDFACSYASANECDIEKLVNCTVDLFDMGARDVCEFIVRLSQSADEKDVEIIKNTIEKRLKPNESLSEVLYNLTIKRIDDEGYGV